MHRVSADTSSGDPLPARVDAVIVGAGLAGLSLACHLVAAGWGDRRVMLVEPHPGVLRRSGWAYWSRGADLFDPAASSVFDRLRIRTSDEERTLLMDDYRYRVVAGVDLQCAAEAYVAGAPGFRFVRGHVRTVTNDADGVVVTFDPADGPETRAVTVRADWAFDSAGVSGSFRRPPSARMEFQGLRVTSKTDDFDVTTPTLMDFRVAQDDGPAFCYVLPTSPRSALVESAQFLPASSVPQVQDTSTALRDYLRERLSITGFRVNGSETGSLALSVAPVPRPRGRVIGIGIPAGNVRPSTGYGWTRIDRHSAALARSLVQHGHPYGVRPHGLRARVMDALLLDVIAHEPDAFIPILTSMFAADPADLIVRFLNETSSLRDDLAVARSVSSQPFTRAAMRRVCTAAGKWFR